MSFFTQKATGSVDSKYGGSGVIAGGQVTVAAEGAAVTVAGGAGRLFRGEGRDSQAVRWRQTTIAAASLPATDHAYIGVDAAGSVVAETARGSDTTRILLGVLEIEAGPPRRIGGWRASKMPVYNLGGQLRELIEAFGSRVLTGNRLAAHPGTLSFEKGAGRAFVPGIPGTTGGERFHTLDVPRLSVADDGFTYMFSDGTRSARRTALDPALLDTGKGAGRPGTVRSSRASTQWVFYDVGRQELVIQPGQAEYRNIDRAIDAAQDDDFELAAHLADWGVPLGAVVLRGGDKNLDGARFLAEACNNLAYRGGRTHTIQEAYEAGLAAAARSGGGGGGGGRGSDSDSDGDGDDAAPTLALRSPGMVLALAAPPAAPAPVLRVRGAGGAVVLDARTDGVALGPRARVAAGTPPASATSPGETGELAWDREYLYICLASGAWRRVRHESW
jgi:hypothetical protein